MCQTVCKKRCMNWKTYLFIYRIFFAFSGRSDIKSSFSALKRDKTPNETQNHTLIQKPTQLLPCLLLKTWTFKKEKTFHEWKILPDIKSNSKVWFNCMSQNTVESSVSPCPTPTLCLKENWHSVSQNQDQDVSLTLLQKVRGSFLALVSGWLQLSRT